MVRKKIEYLSEKEVSALSSELNEENNPYICETAGFIPLEIKFKRFEQAGQMARLNASDFTSSDYREMYQSPDFDIYPDDDLDEIEEKMIALKKHITEVKKKVYERTKNEKQEKIEKETIIEEKEE